MNESKTIREWLNDLPEPYRSRAIKNAENDMANWDGLEDDLEDAIGAAFMWARTPEGLEYWIDVSMGKTQELPEHINEVK